MRLISRQLFSIFFFGPDITVVSGNIGIDEKSLEADCGHGAVKYIFFLPLMGIDVCSVSTSSKLSFYLY